MSETTPTPWFWDGDWITPTIFGKDRTAICEVDPNKHGQENARLIVRAVNAHDALLDVARKVDAFFEGVNGPLPTAARAALALAEAD